MTKQELLEFLKDCKDAKDADTEGSHIAADIALLEYINDPEITEAFLALPKWYA